MVLLENILIACLAGIATLIFIRMLIEFVISLSGLRLDRSNFIYKFLHDFTEPFYKPFRKVLPQAVNLDMSPLFAIISISVLIALLQGIFKNLNVLIKI